MRKKFLKLNNFMKGLLWIFCFVVMGFAGSFMDEKYDETLISYIASVFFLTSLAFIFIIPYWLYKQRKLIEKQNREQELEQAVIKQKKSDAEKELKRNEYLASVEMKKQEREIEIKNLSKKYESLHIILTGNKKIEMQDNISFCEINDEVEIEYNYDNGKLLVSSGYDIGYLPNKYDYLIDVSHKAFVESIDLNDEDDYVVSIIAFLINKPRELSLPLYTKVVGVTFENRQEHLINSKKNNELIIKHTPTSEHPNSMVVINKSIDKVLGYIKSELAKDLINKYGELCTFKGTIKEITGGEKNNNYGCNISIDKIV